MMQTCPHCGRENPEHDAYCYACGHILPSALKQMAKDDPTTKLDQDAYEALEPRRRWGTAYFDRKSQLKLTFRDTGNSVLVNVSGKLIIGRIHDQTAEGRLADVDLTPYGAVEAGVSRNHVALMRDLDTITVTDLNSSNSTFLNGQRLMPNEPRILRDNDELRLGRLVIRVAFV
jgi:hypothetical protein